MARRGIRMTPSTILLVAAIVVFVIAAFGASIGDVSLVALGLALFAAAFVVR